MHRTFVLCFVHSLNPDKNTPVKNTNRIRAHVLQASCATFVWSCARIRAQRDDDPPKCHSKPSARDMLHNETMSMSIKALISRTIEHWLIVVHLYIYNLCILSELTVLCERENHVRPEEKSCRCPQ